MLYKTDLEQNQSTSARLRHHHRIGARARLEQLPSTPKGRYEIGQEVLPVDSLKFRTAKNTPSA